ncbi:uncharacterized protein C8Q71DRAFT_383730 [Rhodofomes roseus]|uniref:Uncharacterized protein n=1 Tax=Rhodofomes roseus TaxID=34475 RepID=A0ABQ8K026_9APHY|nr:uncharacterized protein C8Q71DRAFT_383730 [Rhodofomes roseus]KAH9829934.1 hypothetical protein C8Q71DRAFT_383730 [Rhodofomes roseus]
MRMARWVLIRTEHTEFSRPVIPCGPDMESQAAGHPRGRKGQSTPLDNMHGLSSSGSGVFVGTCLRRRGKGKPTDALGYLACVRDVAAAPVLAANNFRERRMPRGCVTVRVRPSCEEQRANPSAVARPQSIISPRTRSSTILVTGSPSLSLGGKPKANVVPFRTDAWRILVGARQPRGKSIYVCVCGRRHASSRPRTSYASSSNEPCISPRPSTLVVFWRAPARTPPTRARDRAWPDVSADVRQALASPAALTSNLRSLPEMGPLITRTKQWPRRPPLLRASTRHARPARTSRHAFFSPNRSRSSPFQFLARFHPRRVPCTPHVEPSRRALTF